MKNLVVGAGTNSQSFFKDGVLIAAVWKLGSEAARVHLIQSGSFYESEDLAQFVSACEELDFIEKHIESKQS
jgi:hypothetical protein